MDFTCETIRNENQTLAKDLTMKQALALQGITRHGTEERTPKMAKNILKAISKTAKNNPERVETMRDNPKSKKWKEGGLALRMELMGRQKIETLYFCIFRPLRYHALAQWLNVRLHKFTCIAGNQVCQDVIVAPCKKGKTVAKRCEHVDLPRNFNSWQKSVVPNKRMHVHPKSGLPRFDYSPSCQGLAD